MLFDVLFYVAFDRLSGYLVLNILVYGLHLIEDVPCF